MTISADTRQIIREKFRYCCGYCGISESDVGGELEIDHFQPASKGGTNDIDNLVYACVHCNRFKGNYWPDETGSHAYLLLRPDKPDYAEHVDLTINGRFALSSGQRKCTM